jgi:hypothetical protein
VIQDVEEIASELQRNPFCKAELAAQGDIPLVAPKRRRALRPRLPCAVAGTGMVNAAGFMNLPSSRFPQHRLW